MLNQSANSSSRGETYAADTQSVFHLVLPVREGELTELEEALNRPNGRFALCCCCAGQGQS